METRIVLIIFCFAGCLHEVLAQESTSAARQTNAIERLDSIGRRMESYLESVPAYEVDVKQQWKVDGDHQTQGVNRFLLIHRHDGAFKLKVGNEDAQNSTLTCLGDGRTITRVLEFEDQFIHARKQGGMNELLHDVMTDHSLRYSGLDVLCREHPLHYIMTMASEAKYVGEEQLAAGRADHFQMEWGEGNSHQMNLWFSTGDAPLLVRIASSIEFHPDENVRHTITTTADLSWKTGQHQLRRVLQHPLWLRPKAALRLCGLCVSIGTVADSSKRLRATGFASALPRRKRTLAKPVAHQLRRVGFCLSHSINATKFLVLYGLRSVQKSNSRVRAQFKNYSSRRTEAGLELCSTH